MSTACVHQLILAQVQSTGFWSTALSGIDPDKRFVLLIIAIGCTIPIVLGTLGIITSSIDAIHRRRVEMELKRDMIERGMSADEIAKVIESTTPAADEKETC
jgi:hypothetical protein